MALDRDTATAIALGLTLLWLLVRLRRCALGRSARPGPRAWWRFGSKLPAAQDAWRLEQADREREIDARLRDRKLGKGARRR